MAAPTITAGTLAANGTSGTTQVVTLPTHAADDILVVTALCNQASTLSIDVGYTAFTLAGGDVNPLSDAALSTAIWWKRATSGSETNPTVTSSTAASASNVILGKPYTVSGCDTSGDPYDVAHANPAGAQTTSTAPASGSITTSGSDRLLVHFALIDDNNTMSSGLPPGTYSTLVDENTAVGGDAQLATIYKAVPSATTQSGVTVGTMSASDPWRVFSVAFKPPAGGGGGPTLRLLAATGVGA